ncbi:MAG: phage coat protein [Oscillospiraceae bacterium]|nr:phage coat protein [Oscillospiraceae bacterium]
MPGIFDEKIFNAEVFQGYVDRIPNTKRKALITSRAIRPRPDLASAMKDQTGGNYITTTMRGLISGSVPQNYDGKTDMTPNKTKTFRHSRVVVGRMNAWTENDFSFDITGGEDFLENVAEQISEYWSEIDQDTLLCILKGIFNMTGAANLKFVENHTYDITDVENSEGKVGHMDATSLNSAMQQACGDNKSSFALVCMHSVVATNLENLKLLTYLKYTDANGMEREIGLATLNGRLVLIDDAMPVKEVEGSEAVTAVAETKGVYTLTVSAAAIAEDKLEIKLGGETVVTYLADGDATAAGVGGTLRTMCKGCAAITDLFTVTGTGANVVFTQKVGGTGTTPTVTCTQTTSGTIAASVATTTAGVAAVAAKAAVAAHKEYTTYALGEGAIEYTDCGAKTPYEVDRDPRTNGGQDTLYSRQRKCFAPYGISFTQNSMATLSPTDAELEDGINWELVNSMTDGEAEYIDHKAIPIARIISRG